MTYGLRSKGLICPLERSHTYMLTDAGSRVAAIYTKVYGRVLAPLLMADQPPAAELRQALRVIDHTVADYVERARLRRTARNLTHLFRSAPPRRSTSAALSNAHGVLQLWDWDVAQVALGHLEHAANAAIEHDPGGRQRETFYFRARDVGRH